MRTMQVQNRSLKFPSRVATFLGADAVSRLTRPNVLIARHEWHKERERDTAYTRISVILSEKTNERSPVKSLSRGEQCCWAICSRARVEISLFLDSCETYFIFNEVAFAWCVLQTWVIVVSRTTSPTCLGTRGRGSGARSASARTAARSSAPRRVFSARHSTARTPPPLAKYLIDAAPPAPQVLFSLVFILNLV